MQCHSAASLGNSTFTPGGTHCVHWVSPSLTSCAHQPHHPAGCPLGRCRRVKAAGQVFSEDFIWSVLLQVGDALRHLHSLHIMHRWAL